MRESCLHLCAGHVRQHANLLHGGVAEVNNGILYAHAFRRSKRFGDGVPCHVQVTERQLANACVGSVIGLRRVHAVQQFLRQRSACLVMLGKCVQELFLVDEVLVELTRQLHEIARHVGAGRVVVLATGEHAVKAVSELVQEGANLVIGKQRGLGVRGAGEVHHVHDVRTAVGLALAPLRLEVVHPRTSALAVPRVEIGIIHGQIFALLVKHLVGANLRVVGLDIFVLLEGDAVQTLGQTKHALFNGLQLEIRTQVVVGDGVFLVL